MRQPAIMMWLLAVMCLLGFTNEVSARQFACGESRSEVLEHGDYVIDRATNVIRAVCHHGYKLGGEGTRRCDVTLGWSGAPPTCTDIDECSVTLARCHRRAICTNTQGGFTCTCPAGRFVGNGRKEAKGCTTLKCKVPHVANANVTWSRGRNTMYFTCHVLHRMEGEESISCIRSKFTWGWTAPPPSCKKVPMCRTPVPMDNGRVVSATPPFVIGSTVLLACNSEYDLILPNTWVCSYGERWAGQEKTRCKKTGLEILEKNLQRTLDHVNKNLNSPPPNVNARFNVNDKRGVDIGFLLDTSSSVTHSQFKKAMELVKLLVLELQLDRNTNVAHNNATGHKRVMVMTFAGVPKVHFTLRESAHWTTEDTIKRLDAITADGGETKLLRALNDMRSEMGEWGVKDGAGKNNAVQVLFIMTDGGVEEITTRMDTLIYGLRDLDKVEIYVIGIGLIGYMQKENLQKLSGRTDDSHTFILNDYDELKQLTDYVVDRKLDSEKCGRSVGNDNQAALGRSHAHAWPWNVYITVRIGSEYFHCGGVLICAGWVLTSAQCVRSQGSVITVQDVTVALGPSGSDMRQHVRLQRIVVHPKYLTLFPHIHDLALLALAHSPGVQLSKSIRTVCLANEMAPKFIQQTPWTTPYLYNAGWGVRNDDRKLSTYSQLHHQKSTTLMTNDDCDIMLNTRITKDSKFKLNLACLEKTKIPVEVAEVCYGDIGGPVVWRSGAGEDPVRPAHVVAIITHNSVCDQLGHNYTVVTSLHAYTAWIYQVTSSCSLKYAKKTLDHGNAGKV